MENLSSAPRVRLGRAPLCAALLSMALVTGLAHSAAAQVQTVQEAVQEGVTLFQEGRIPEAIDRLRRAGDAFPTEPLVWMALGQVYEAARQPQEAIPSYRRVIELAPGSEDAKRASARLGQLGTDRETHEAAQRDFQAAVKALTAQDWTTAEASLRQVLNRIPSHLPSLLFLGNIAERTDRDEEALSRWQAAVAIDPTFYPAQVSLGRVYERKGRLADAVSAYRAAVATNVAHPDVEFAARRLTQIGATPEQAAQVRAWMEEAAEAAKAGRADETRRAFERVVSVLPTHAPANFALGLIAAKRGQSIDAARILKQGLAGDPDYYPALFLLAELEEGQGQFEQAAEHYRRVVQLVGPQREGVEAFRRLPALEEKREAAKALKAGLLLESRKYFDEGIEAFQKQDYESAFKAFGRAMVLDETNPYYVFNRGLAAFNLGNNLVAAQSFERVIELAPAFGLAHFWLGVMFQASAEQARDAGNLPEAQAEYRAVVDKLGLAIRHGEGAWYLEEAEKRLTEGKTFLDRYQEHVGFITVGGVLGAQSRWNEALAVFGVAAQRFAYDYQPFLNIGAILTDLKRYDEAQAAFDQAIKVNPKTPKPYLQMGFMFEAQERWDDAINAYRKVIELAPEAWEPHSALGTVLMLKERNDEAIVELERTVELAGGTAPPRTHWNLGFLYFKIGRNADALVQFRKTRDLLAGRTEQESVELRRTAEDYIASLEVALRPYRITLSAEPFSYNSNLFSASTNPLNPIPVSAEVSSSVGASLVYYLISDENLKVQGNFSHNQSYSYLVRQVLNTQTAVGGSTTFVLRPLIDLGGTANWSYNHGTDGPQAFVQSLSATITKRGQLPSAIALVLSYSTSKGLGGSTVQNAVVGYSASMDQTLGNAGSVRTSFSMSSNDSNVPRQVKQEKTLSFSYNRPLGKAISAGFNYALAISDFVNPFFTVNPTIPNQPVIQLFNRSILKSYGLNLTHSFRSDFDIAINLGVISNESDIDLGGADPDAVKNNLQDPSVSPFRRRTLSLSVSKTF